MWHTEGKDLVFKAIILEILVEVALMAVQNEQPVYAPPHNSLQAIIQVSRALNLLGLFRAVECTLALALLQILLLQLPCDC
jgi:hypothetical protein